MLLSYWIRRVGVVDRTRLRLEEAITEQRATRLGIFILLSGACTAGAVLIVAHGAAVPWPFAGVLAALIGWCVTALQRFLSAQRGVETSTSGRHQRGARAAALLVQTALLGTIGFVIAQPIALWGSLFLSGQGNPATILEMIAAVPVHDPLRWLLTGGVLFVMLAPVHMCAPSASTSCQGLLTRRTLVEAAHVAFRERDYPDAFGVAVGCRRRYPRSFEDPPFNTVPIRPDTSSQSPGSLVAWYRARGGTS